MKLHLTTNPGIEDVVAEELASRADAIGLAIQGTRLRPEGERGLVEVELESAPEALWAPLRSVHHVLQPLDRFTFDLERPLAQLAERAARLPASVFRDADSFRVTGVRQGEHPFTSLDLARAAGGAIQEATGLTVKMKGYDREVRVELRGRDCRVSIQRTPKPLSRRYPDKENLRTALSANVAFALLRLTLEGREPAVLLDPCCGTGTVLLEAGALYPQARLLAGDRFERPAGLCRDNLATYGLSARARVEVADARDMQVRWEAEVPDAVVCNPPFGARLGERIDFTDWYGRFVGAFAGLCPPGARMGVLAMKRGAFKRAVRDTPGVSLARSRRLAMGVVEPGLFVVERT